jgi:hypothetical protein
MPGLNIKGIEDKGASFILNASLHYKQEITITECTVSFHVIKIIKNCDKQLIDQDDND